MNRKKIIMIFFFITAVYGCEKKNSDIYITNQSGKSIRKIFIHTCNKDILIENVVNGERRKISYAPNGECQLTVNAESSEGSSFSGVGDYISSDFKLEHRIEITKDGILTLETRVIN